MRCESSPSGASILDGRHASQFSNFCTSLEAGPPDMHTTVENNGSRNICKQSKTSSTFLPIIGVSPGTFQTFIDLTDEDSADPEVYKLPGPSSFSPLVNVLTQSPTNSLHPLWKSEGADLEIKFEDNTGPQISPLISNSSPSTNKIFESFSLSLRISSSTWNGEAGSIVEEPNGSSNRENRLVL
jgi:hypothetical protein